MVAQRGSWYIAPTTIETLLAEDAPGVGFATTKANIKTLPEGTVNAFKVPLETPHHHHPR